MIGFAMKWIIRTSSLYLELLKLSSLNLRESWQVDYTDMVQGSAVIACNYCSYLLGLYGSGIQIVCGNLGE